MKKMFLILLLAATQCFAGTMVASGDSITYGVAATSGNSYISLLGGALSTSITNYAVSGDQAADQAIRTYGVTLGSGDRATVMIGTNDQWKYGTSAYKQALYKTFLTQIIANFAMPTKTFANTVGVSYTGSWVASQPTWSKGKWSATAGSTAITTVSGTAVYIGVIKQEDLNGNPINGTADVYVDNVQVGSIGSAGTGMTTQNGNAYAPAAYRFGGLGAGSHVVKVVITSAYSDYRGIMYLEYVAGSSQIIKPDVYVSNILRYGPLGYSLVGGSDANVAAINGIISGTAAYFVTDQLAVHFMDVSSAVNQTTDLNPSDEIHPVDAGHLKIKTVEYGAMTGGITFTLNSLYRGSDSIWYIDNGSGKVPFVYP